MHTVNTFKDILYIKGLEYYGKFYSMYKGRCVDNKDPKNQNRIKVSCAEVYGLNQVHEFWVLPLNIPMVENFFIIQPPNVGEEVILFFRKGNLRYPTYLRTPQKSNLVDINTVLNSNEITPELFTALLANTIIDITNEQFLLKQGGTNDLKITKDKTIIGQENEVEANVKGDTLRQQLKEIKEEQVKLTEAVTTLVTALGSYTVSSGVLVPNLLPAANTISQPLVNLLIDLQQVKTKLNNIDIDESKSDVLYNN